MKKMSNVRSIGLFSLLLGYRFILCQTQCPVLENPDDGEVIMSGQDVGDTATYSCEAGFFLSEIVLRNCRRDFTWTDSEPICVKAPPLSCIVKRPFVRPNEDVTVTIYGVPGSLEDTGDVRFSRDFDTKNAVGGNIGDQKNRDYGRELQMPLKRKKTERGERFGIFACSVNHVDGSRYTIRTAITSARKGLVPSDERISRTVSLGDRVDLSVTSTRGSRRRIRWLQNGNSKPQWRRQFSVSIAKATPRDQGIYEIFQRGRRKRGLQTFILLYVRECPERLYGTECDKVCECQNGGLCDDKTGECTCPPGFDGELCERTYKIMSCYADYDAHECRTLLFCLPGQFGCVCGPGWRGLECNKECLRGTYGAGCTETCEDPCDGRTGPL